MIRLNDWRDPGRLGASVRSGDRAARGADPAALPFHMDACPRTLTDVLPFTFGGSFRLGPGTGQSKLTRSAMRLSRSRGAPAAPCGPSHMWRERCAFRDAARMAVQRDDPQSGSAEVRARGVPPWFDGGMQSLREAADSACLLMTTGAENEGHPALAMVHDVRRCESPRRARTLAAGIGIRCCHGVVTLRDGLGDSERKEPVSARCQDSTCLLGRLRRGEAAEGAQCPCWRGRWISTSSERCISGFQACFILNWR